MTNSVSSPQGKKDYSIASFFAGVGGIELGFLQSGEFRVVYANEFDKYAKETYELNHDIKIDERDIREINESEVPYADVIMGGFPCQAFSIAGYRKGFEDDRGDLFFELLRFIKNNEPQVVFLENVKNMVGHDHGNTFKIIREALVINGYYIKWKVLNAKDYGNTPQNRERIYIVGFKNKDAFNNFEFPDETNLDVRLADIIDFDLITDDRFYYEDGKQPFYDQLKEEIVSQNTVYQWRRQYVRENKSGVVPTLTANMGTGGHNVPLILTNDNRIRKLTPKETFNAQGFPNEFKLPSISNGQLYKQAGNSVVVPVIKRIADNIKEALNKIPQSKEQISFTFKSDFAIIYLELKARFEGESYILDYFDTFEDAKEFAVQRELQLITDEEYIKIIKKGKSGKFLIIEPA